MKYSLECKFLGTPDCEDVIELQNENPQEFLQAVFRHLETKHRPWLLEFYKKSGMIEMHRLIAQRVDRQ